MAESSKPKRTLSIAAIGGAVAVMAGLLGFWDYAVPTATQNLCIDVEEGISDLYVAGLSFFGGILALYGRAGRG